MKMETAFVAIQVVLIYVLATIMLKLYLKMILAFMMDVKAVLIAQL